MKERPPALTGSHPFTCTRQVRGWGLSFYLFGTMLVKCSEKVVSTLHATSIRVQVALATILNVKAHY